MVDKHDQGPKLVKMNLQHSQAQPYGICTHVISLIKTLYMWSTILKVFGKTWTLVDPNRRPPDL